MGLQKYPRVLSIPPWGVSADVRAVEVPPCADWAVLCAGRVAIGNEGTLKL